MRVNNVHAFLKGIVIQDWNQPEDKTRFCEIYLFSEDNQKTKPDFVKFTSSQS